MGGSLRRRRYCIGASDRPGYLVEGLVVFKGVRSLARKARGAEHAGGPARAATDRPFVPWGFVVEHFDAQRPMRPTEEVPRDIQEYYGVRQEILEEVRREVSRRVLEAKPDESPILILLPPLSVKATLELYPAKGASPQNPRPLVLMTPPTKGAFAARYLAGRFARRGIHAAIIVPENTFLETHLTPADVEGRFRDTVVAARIALRVLREMNEVDAGHLHYLGISAGGIFGGALLAVEPSIRRAVRVLPGGDLPRIVKEISRRIPLQPPTG